MSTPSPVPSRAEPTGGAERGDHATRSRATQQRILDAAVEVLVERGYAGASTLRIQERAEVSRGRLLHQYPNRDALLVAAVRHIAEGRVAARPSDVDWPDGDRERVLDVVRQMWATYHHGYFWAASELWLAARHNPSLRAALAPYEQELGVSVKASLDAMFGPRLASHPRYPALRDVLNTSMRGVAMAYSFSPRDPATDPFLGEWQQLALRELGLADV